MERREAIEIVREYYPSSGKDLNEALETLIPELKESEDERIRKELLAHIQQERASSTLKVNHAKWDKMIAWLEKQGSQNLANSAKTCKDGPKFKVGDTIHEIGERYIFPMVIEEIKDGDYVCDNESSFINIEFQDKYELVEQNPAWSEEDETGLNDAMWAIEQARTTAKNENDMGNLWYAERWLKSLKSRVQPQPKSEWSEEDEIKYMAICDWLCSNSSSKFKGFRSFELSDWLNSLKEKCTWRPSDEQMSILFKYAEQNNADGSELSSLYDDLKKLKG